MPIPQMNEQERWENVQHQANAIFPHLGKLRQVSIYAVTNYLLWLQGDQPTKQYIKSMPYIVLGFILVESKGK